jgi:hypothetical protein
VTAAGDGKYSQTVGTNGSVSFLLLYCEAGFFPSRYFFIHQIFFFDIVTNFI